MRNQKKSGFRKLSGMNKVSLNADKHEGRFMHRAMKSMPWLICASTAWLTLVPCEIAFAVTPLLALTMFFAIKMKVNRLKAADSLLINLWQIKQ